MMWRDRTEAKMVIAMIICAVLQAIATFWLLFGEKLDVIP